MYLIVERKCSVQIEMHSKLQLNCHDMFTISVDDVIKSVDKLKSGKSDEDSIYSDHIINGTPKLFVLFTRMCNAMLVHGSCPMSMVNGTMIPIPKGRRVNMSSSGAGFMNRRRLCQLTAAILTGDLTTRMWVL